MIQYPLQFPVKVVAEGGAQKPWVSSASLPSALACAVPAEFEGPGGGYSPEDFFALAVANCFAATFQVIAEKSRVPFTRLEIQGKLTVDRDEQGRPWMKHMLLEITVHAEGGDAGRIQRILEKTSQSCLVIHSVKTQVDFQFEVKV
jgi:organic hydroperoxide reductase OsmC/OhrA